MLLKLKIQNLLFIEEAEISFAQGLNILTGETGAGKSAILSAICLIAGLRAEQQIIGKHKEFAVVEASVSHYTLPEELVAPEKGSPLLIRREILKSGKNRCFVNDQQVSLSTLKQITSPIIEVIDQASSQLLYNREQQRFFVDLFGNSMEEAKELSQSVMETERLQTELDTLLEIHKTREQDLAWSQEDLTFMDQVGLQPEEEETLAKEHHELIHAQELGEKLSALSGSLGEHLLKRALSLFDGCVRLDQNLAPLLEKLKNISCELDEFSHKVHSHIHKIETDPNRLNAVEARMKTIDQLKRKFGKTFHEIQKKREECLKKIDQLTYLDEHISKLQTTISGRKTQSERFAGALSLKRKQNAAIFEKELLSELQSLNLPHAQFKIAITLTSLTSHGIDAIDFLFSANPDRPPVPIQDCASGGELSRLFLSLKTVLADKQDNHCLVFDEIDGNVGGQTAVVLGEKLKTIAKKKQVICITHFVQVARLAHMHFVVTKKQREGLTITHISPLDLTGKEKEYQRMLGGAS